MARFNGAWTMAGRDAFRPAVRLCPPQVFCFAFPHLVLLRLTGATTGRARGVQRSDWPMARAGMTVGLFGGSFDPPHAGHVHVSREALKRLGLDRVWWLVSPGNPLKERGPAPLERRMAARKGCGDASPGSSSRISRPVWALRYNRRDGGGADRALSGCALRLAHGVGQLSHSSIAGSAGRTSCAWCRSAFSRGRAHPGNSGPARRGRRRYFVPRADRPPARVSSPIGPPPHGCS